MILKNAVKKLFPRPVKLLVVGAGSRGTTYAEYARYHPEQARIVGIAEPREYFRAHLAEEHDISSKNVFADWREAAAAKKLADAVIIATEDTQHAGPAVSFAEKGYHILLEKPMAINEDDCRQIVEAVVANKVIFAVCHVLRYAQYTRQLKDAIASGLIGDVVNIQHLEPIGYWHFAHSFVRGNWSRESDSSFILLTKSCHDLDWIRYIIGTRCLSISSFGTLRHFRKEQKPSAASDRCLDCEIDSQCPYSAKRLYLDRVRLGHAHWPVDVLTPDVTPQGIEDALRSGPYGRCVYECDNDVLDNQVVNLLFANDKTATFTLTAFTEFGSRRTSIFGTLGELYVDEEKIRHVSFLENSTETIKIAPSDVPILQSHGGGDYALMDSFVSAVANNDPKAILSGPAETLETHLMVFAAEKARLESRVVHLHQYE